jgi:hypothetical protein
MSYHANDRHHTLTADFSRGLCRMHKDECISAGTVNNLPSAYPHARAAAAAHAGKAPSAHHAATARTAHGMRCALERSPRRRCENPRPCAPCCTMLPLAPGLTATLKKAVRGESKWSAPKSGLELKTTNPQIFGNSRMNFFFYSGST